MDATFQFFNSPSSSSASSVCGDDDVPSNTGDDDKCINNIENDYALNKMPTHCDMSANNETVNSTNKCDESVSTTAASTNQNNNNNDDEIKENCNKNTGTTLQLHFSHSSNVCTSKVSDDNQTINSPLDIYKQFGGIVAPIDDSTATQQYIAKDELPANHYHNESSPVSADAPIADDYAKLKEYVLKVANLNTNEIYDKTKENIEMRNLEKTQTGDSNAATDIPNNNVKPKKSILKNRDAVKNEVHCDDVSFEQDDDYVDGKDQFSEPFSLPFLLFFNFGISKFFFVDSMQPFFAQQEPTPFRGFNQVFFGKLLWFSFAENLIHVSFLLLYR